MRLTKEYIEENIGLKREKDVNGGVYYELKEEGVFIQDEDSSYWVFIPNEPVKLIRNVEFFELYVR